MEGRLDSPRLQSSLMKVSVRVPVVRETSGCSSTNSQAAFSIRAFAAEYKKNPPLFDVIASSLVVSFQSVTSRYGL